MNYTLHQLKVFLSVVENRSITKASQELFLTQPAVSIQLGKFQEQFSIPLTELVGRQVYITEFGQEIAEISRNILQQVDTINYKTKSFENKLAGRLKISVVSTGKYVMPYFLSGFMAMHKGIDLVMDVTNKSSVIRSLEENTVDFSLVSVIPDELKINTVPLLQNKLYLVGGKVLLQDIEKFSRKQFENHPMLYREPGSATRKAMEDFIQLHQIPVHKKIELTSNEALKQAVVAGLGFSVMPLIGLKNELGNGDLRIIPYKNLPIITQWNLIWLQSKNLSPVANAFLNYIQKEKEEIIKNKFSWYENY